jgi:hypothetical protein
VPSPPIRDRRRAHRCYRFGPLTVESAVSLPELPAACSGTVDVTLRFRRRPFQTLPSAWSHHWTLPNGDLWMSMGRLETDYVFRFPEYADFAMSADGRSVTAFRQPGVPSRTVRHLFLDQVFPILLSRWGHTVLHGSAVTTPHGALAFVGESGRGKSTLAAALVQSGQSLLTDDCLMLRRSDAGPEAIPSYPGLRLWPDVLPAVTGSKTRLPRVTNYSVKRRLGPDNAEIKYSPHPAAIRAIYFLGEPTAEISIKPIPARRAMIELVKFNYLYDVKDRGALTSQFTGLSALARLPLFFSLVYPTDLAQLAKVCDAILDHAANA